MSTATATNKFTRETQVFALWKNKSKDGKKTYFTGKVNTTGELLTGFYNTDKKNLKEPDLRVYLRDSEGNLSKETFVDLWCNPTKKGDKKILSGKLNGKRVIGFINEKFENGPYISVYFSDDSVKADKKEEPKKATKPAKAKKVEEEDDLPF